MAEVAFFFMGPKVGRKRQHHGIRDNKRSKRTRARTKDLDQVFEELAKLKRECATEPLKDLAADADLPGFGQHYCVHCARHFISHDTYTVHTRTKLHKKRVKVLSNDTPYSQKEAELAAGLQTDNGPGRL